MASSREANFEEFDAQIPEVREKFMQQYAESISEGLYDTRDLERLEIEDAVVSCYLKHQKGSLERTVGMINTSLKWRKEIGVNDLTEEYFPRWAHEVGAIYYHNQDKDGQSILFFQVGKNKKDPERLPIVKKFVAWWIERHYIKHPGERLCVLFDMSEAGFSNMDIDLIKFQINCFTTYFPFVLAYMLVYEMPWVLNTVWKVIKNILSAEQQKAVIFVKKNEIQKYIAADQLPESMGGTDTYQYTYLPSEDSGIDIPVTNGDVPHSRDNSAANSPLKKRVTFAENDQTSMFTSFEGTAAGDDVTIAKTPSKPRSLKLKKPDEEPSCFVGALAAITPADQFNFIVTDKTRETMDLLTIKNILDRQIAYKVKTTAPDSYRVRPSSGLMKTGDSAEIQVYLQPGHTAVSRDKFLVMILDVGDSVSSSATLQDMWRQPRVAPEKYMEHRVWCSVTVSPVSPTQPTPQSMTTEQQMANISKQSFPQPGYPYPAFCGGWPLLPTFLPPGMDLLQQQQKPASSSAHAQKQLVNTKSNSTESESNKSDSVSTEAGKGDRHSVKIPIHKGLEQVLQNQSTLEQRMSRLVTVQVVLVIILVLVGIALLVVYAVGIETPCVHNVHPRAEHTDHTHGASCTPYFWQS